MVYFRDSLASFEIPSSPCAQRTRAKTKDEAVLRANVAHFPGDGLRAERQDGGELHIVDREGRLIAKFSKDFTGESDGDGLLVSLHGTSGADLPAELPKSTTDRRFSFGPDIVTEYRASFDPDTARRIAELQRRNEASRPARVR